MYPNSRTAIVRLGSVWKRGRRSTILGTALSLPIGDASTVSTTWRINTGGWNHASSFSMNDCKSGGVLKLPAYDSTTMTPNFNMVRPFVVNNGYTISMRVKGTIDPLYMAKYAGNTRYYGAVSYETFFDTTSTQLFVYSSQRDSTLSWVNYISPVSSPKIRPFKVRVNKPELVNFKFYKHEKKI